MSRKWNLIIDAARCNNCRNCFLATKDEHIGNEFPGYAAAQPARGHSWVDIQANERGCWPILEANFVPVMCNHCDRPPCARAAKGGAVEKRADGIVIIDPEKSKGQREIMEACPYGAAWWNEEKQIPQAWIFDAHLLDQGWEKTRVESVCASEVFRSVKVADAEMQRLVEEEGLEVLRPQEGTLPRVYYKNLHLMNQCFVSATIVVRSDGIEDCAEGATVVLKRTGEEVARTTTDIFGEFKIDRLDKNSGPYELEIMTDSKRRLLATFEVVNESLYLGALVLGAEANGGQK